MTGHTAKISRLPPDAAHPPQHIPQRNRGLLEYAVTLAQSPSVLHAHGSQLRALDSARLLTDPSLLGIAPYPAPTTDTPVSPKRPSHISYDWVRSSGVKSTGFTFNLGT